MKFKIGKKSLTRISLVMILIFFVLIMLIIPSYTKSDYSDPNIRVDDPIIRGNLWSKKVVVYDENRHYYNVSVSASIPENLINVELYRYLTPDLMMKVTNNPAYSFQVIDSDGNGLTDTVKWVVPELPEVSFSVEGKLTSVLPTLKTPLMERGINVIKLDFNETRQDNIGLPKNWFVKNIEEFEDGDEINWTYSPLITDNFSNSTSLLVNVTQLAAEESFISSRVVEVTPNTRYKVSFFIKNTTFADETKEFADISIYEFDDNQNPTSLSGAILRFNSTHLLKVTEPFDVIEENVKNLGRKVTILFPTTIDGRYEKFILSYIYLGGDCSGPCVEWFKNQSVYYVLDDFRIEKLTEGGV